MDNLTYLGLGSNINQPNDHITRAFQEISALDGITAMRCSSRYRTAPLGFIEQPDFINAVAEIKTSLTAEKLLATLMELEQQHGRTRLKKNGPRSLDLDILLFGDVTMNNAHLTLPHPRMHERAFVLVPLVEINADIMIPGRGSAQMLLAKISPAGVVKI